MILAIDTSSAVTVLGTGTADGPGINVRAAGARRHAEAIDVLFADHVAADRLDIEAVVVGIGPGPYSGLRVGIAFGVGLGRSLDVPVLGVCSLDARAWQVVDDSLVEVGQEFAVSADARRAEIYWASYRVHVNGPVERTAGPRVVDSTSAPHCDASFPDVEINAARVAARVARLRDQGVVAIDPNPTLVPHGMDAALSTLPAGPLFTPRPLYLRQPDVTITGGTGPGQ